MIADPKMVPHTQTDRVRVLSRSNTNTPTALSYVLYGAMSIQMTHEQARQAATICLDVVKPEAFVLQYARSFTYHGAQQWPADL